MPQVEQITVKDGNGIDRDVATLTAIVTLLGEVQPNPTSNTVLDRLKAILTGIVLASGSNVIGGVNLITGQTGITGGAGAVAANTPRVTHASDDPVVAALSTLNAKDFATQTTLAAILTKIIAAPATEAKQDTIIASLASILTSTVLAAGANVIGATKDGGPNWTTVWGVSGAPFTSSDQHSAVASVTDAPTSGQKLVLDDLLVSVDTAMSVTFKEETSAAIVLGPVYLPANGTLVWTPRGKGKKLAVANKKLQVITSVAGNIMVDAGYHSEV